MKEYKGELKGVPEEIVKRMLECQKDASLTNCYTSMIAKTGTLFTVKSIVCIDSVVTGLRKATKKERQRLITATELEKGKVFNEKTKMFEVPAPQRVTIVYNYIFVNTTK